MTGLSRHFTFSFEQNFPEIVENGLETTFFVSGPTGHIENRVRLQCLIHSPIFIVYLTSRSHFASNSTDFSCNYPIKIVQMFVLMR